MTFTGYQELEAVKSNRLIILTAKINNKKS